MVTEFLIQLKVQATDDRRQAIGDRRQTASLFAKKKQLHEEERNAIVIDEYREIFEFFTIELYEENFKFTFTFPIISSNFSRELSFNSPFLPNNPIQSMMLSN